MTKTIVIVSFALFAIVLFGWLGTQQFNKSQKAPITPKEAPDFLLKDVNGHDIALSSFRGKVVYLKFWASWCGDCIKQVVPQRHIEEELKNFPDIQFINVSIDKDPIAWKKAVSRNKLHAIELISLGGHEGNINDLYKLDEIPHYVLIGKKGMILDLDAPHPTEIDAKYLKDLQ